MTTLQEIIDEAKRHEFVFKNRDGKTLFKLSLLWTIVVAIAAPQLLPVVLILMLLSLLIVEYDGRSLLDLGTNDNGHKA